MLLATSAVLVTLSLLPLASSSYYQPCEYIECYLFQNVPLNQITSRTHEKNDIMSAMKRMGFNRMTDLLEKSGLAANLTTTGPFTVFAMTDAGFDELKSKSPTWHNTFTTNLERAALVLSDHIVNELLPRSRIRPGMSAMSEGGPIYFDAVDNGRRMAVNGSRILGEMAVDNGVIYPVTNLIIEDIFNMLPYMPMTIGEDCSIMMEALEKTGVSKYIDRPQSFGQFTLFVPTDKAMKALPPGTLDILRKDPGLMKELMLNHLLPTALFTNEEKEPLNGFLQTLGGTTIPFEKTADGQMTVGINKARLIFPNRPGNNGINHIIDKVIMFG